MPVGQWMDTERARLMAHRILVNLIQVLTALVCALLISGAQSHEGDRLVETRAERVPAVPRPLEALSQGRSRLRSGVVALSLHAVHGARDAIFASLPIPVLTDYPPLVAFTDDMLGGGWRARPQLARLAQPVNDAYGTFATRLRPWRRERLEGQFGRVASVRASEASQLDQQRRELAAMIERSLPGNRT
jgi:hypothetical protein